VSRLFSGVSRAGLNIDVILVEIHSIIVRYVSGFWSASSFQLLISDSCLNDETFLPRALRWRPWSDISQLQRGGLGSVFLGAMVDLTKTFANPPVIALARYELNRVMNPSQDNE